LAAARTLKASNHEVVLFEKNREVGGRVATRRQDGYVWDTGATSFAPRGKALEAVMLSELDTADLVRLEKPIYLHSGLRPTASEHRPAVYRYTYRSGNTKLPKMLAEGHDVRLETQIDAIEPEGEGYRIGAEGFDALILTPPIPQSSLLLWGLGESRPTANAVYRACISVNLGYEVELPPTGYHALLDPEQRHPLNWLSLESEKSPGRAPIGGAALSAQLGPSFSIEQYETPDEDLVDTVGSFMAQLYGSAFRHPSTFNVVRWKYSQPVGYASFEEANPPGTRLLLASDALLGGRVEDAYEVGVRAAHALES
jgi:predicted NAD/FAD-dependent oxidoreductase